MLQKNTKTQKQKNTKTQKHKNTENRKQKTENNTKHFENILETLPKYSQNKREISFIDCVSSDQSSVQDPSSHQELVCYNAFAVEHDHKLAFP
jgi:hypothetical protein